MANTIFKQRENRLNRAVFSGRRGIVSVLGSDAIARISRLANGIFKQGRPQGGRNCGVFSVAQRRRGRHLFFRTHAAICLPRRLESPGRLPPRLPDTVHWFRTFFERYARILFAGRVLRDNEPKNLSGQPRTMRIATAIRNKNE